MTVFSALLISCTLVIVVVCIRLAARSASRHTRSVRSGDEVRELRRVITGTAALPAQYADEAASSLEARVVHEVLTANSRAVGVLALNELTADIAFAMEDARTFPSAMGRISLMAGTALGLVSIASGLRAGEGGQSAVWGGVCVALALAGGVTCSGYARVARRAVEKRRDSARELIRALEPRLPPPTP